MSSDRDPEMTSRLRIPFPHPRQMDADSVGHLSEFHNKSLDKGTKSMPTYVNGQKYDTFEGSCQQVASSLETAIESCSTPASGICSGGTISDPRLYGCTCVASSRSIHLQLWLRLRRYPGLRRLLPNGTVPADDGGAGRIHSVY